MIVLQALGSCLPRPHPPTPKKKKLHNHCFQFLLGITVIPREIKDNVKFWGVNKVHYGLCDNGELNEWMVMCFVKLSTNQLFVFNWLWARFQKLISHCQRNCVLYVVSMASPGSFCFSEHNLEWPLMHRCCKLLPVFLIVFILRIAVKAYNK